jgi:2-oxoglutarate ferredoxin oxidoreductase subunit gamma
MGKYEVVLAGSGGQGLIVAGVLLGLAATRHGLYVAQTQSYGVSARGGYCHAEAVISEEEILYPKPAPPARRGLFSSDPLKAAVTLS